MDVEKIEDYFSTETIRRLKLGEGYLSSSIANILNREWTAECQERYALAIFDCEAVLQRPILATYCSSGIRYDTWPEIDEERYLDNELILEMPCPGTFVPATPDEAGRAIYRNTGDIVQLAKKLYGKYLHPDYNFDRDFVVVCGLYTN